MITMGRVKAKECFVGPSEMKDMSSVVLRCLLPLGGGLELNHRCSSPESISGKRMQCFRS